MKEESKEKLYICSIVASETDYNGQTIVNHVIINVNVPVNVPVNVSVMDMAITKYRRFHVNNPSKIHSILVEPLDKLRNGIYSSARCPDIMVKSKHPIQPIKNDKRMINE